MEKRKLRSRAYPAVPLKEAIEILERQTRVLGWGGRDRDSIAKALGYAGGNSGIAARKAAALVQFGLLDLREGLYLPTELAKRILGRDSSAAALQEACFSPLLFREILHLYKPMGRVPLQLARVLSSDHGIQDQARDEVAHIFMASTVYAGILYDDGTFREEQGEARASSAPSVRTSPASMVAGPWSNDQRLRETPAPRESPDGYQILQFFVTDQKEVELRLPARLNEQDILLLRAQIEFLELQVRLNRPDQPVRLDQYRKK